MESHGSIEISVQVMTERHAATLQCSPSPFHFVSRQIHFELPDMQIYLRGLVSWRYPDF